MEWCATLYGEYKIAGKTLRFGRMAVILLCFAIIISSEFSLDPISAEMSAKYPTEEVVMPIKTEGRAHADAPGSESSMAHDDPVSVIPASPGGTGIMVPEMTLPEMTVPEISAVPSIPGEHETVLPSVPDKPETILPSAPDETETILPSAPDEAETILPSVPDEPVSTVPPVTDTVEDPEILEPITVEGYLIDDSGMICGVTEDLPVDDGYLALPSEGCSGIRAGAFANAPSGICEVYIPANITYIEEGAFVGLSDVEWFEMEAAADYYTEDGVIFSEGGTCILSFPPARTETYKVPAGVTRFACGAFAGARTEALDVMACVITDTGDLPETIRLIQ